MNKKILIADDNSEFTSELRAELALCEGYEICAVAGDGEQAEQMYKLHNPDVVLLDLVMPKKDGFGFLQSINKNNCKIVVISALSKDAFVSKAVSLGADYYMRKPCSFKELRSRIDELVNGEKAHAEQRRDTREMDERISNIFITVGIPAHIKGYQFLREAIKMAVENPDIINSITKRLYPEVAKRFDTSPSKVERAIRHAIEVAWNRGKIENINSLFGVKVYGHNEKPTNGEFIALVADKMILESV